MPSVTETTWGVWGEAEPIKAWEHGAPKLHGGTGGSLRPEFADTLRWFYKRAVNPKDKEHCLRLLAQIELKKEDSARSRGQVQSADGKLIVKGEKVSSSNPGIQRPVSAKSPTVRIVSATRRPRPKSAFQVQQTQETQVTTEPAQTTAVEKPGDTEKLSSYQRQQLAIERLSKPKTPKENSTVRKSKTEFRPKSAMAAFGRKRYDDPYLTTHEREFPGYPSEMSAQATRPSSSKGFTGPYELSGPIGSTTFEHDFSWKLKPRVKEIRAGSSSGNRINNPHPHESFMIWRLPRKSAKGMMTAPAPNLAYRRLSNQVFDQILRDQFKTTYECDFLGIPQGYQVKTAIDAPADWQTELRRPLDTTVRYSYMRPQQHPELVLNTTRFGCNKNKGKASIGAVPSVTHNHVKNQELIKAKTTYDTEFRNRFGQPDLEKLLDNQTNKNVMDRFLRYSRVDVPKETSRPASQSSQKGPKWLPKWEGPHHHDHQ